MSYASLQGVSDGNWDENTKEYGAPTWRGGYWFWDGASIVYYGVCTPFGARGTACTKWAAKDLLPPLKVPPYLEDQSVTAQLTQAEIDRARAWIINPQLSNAGNATIPTTGPLDGKVYFGAKLVDARRVVMPYDQARIIAQIIAWSEYNKIDAVDPSAADLIQVPSIDALKESLNVETTPDSEEEGSLPPFWKNQWVLIGAAVLAVVVLAKKRQVTTKGRKTK